MQAAIQGLSTELAKAAARLTNTLVWASLSETAANFYTTVEGDPLAMPSKLGAAYPLLLRLGQYLETDIRVQRDPAILDGPLAPDIHGLLANLVRIAAPWLRGFPTVASWDDAAGKALVRADLFQSARDFTRIAHSNEMISAKDAANIDILVDAASDAGDLQGRKAGARAVSGAKNLMLAAAHAAAAPPSDDTAASEGTPRSLLVQRAKATMLAAEAQVEAFAATMPSDLRQALLALIEDQASPEGRGSSAVPLRKSQPTAGASLTEADIKSDSTNLAAGGNGQHPSARSFDLIGLALSSNLKTFVADEHGSSLKRLVEVQGTQLESDMGLAMPNVRIREDPELPASTYAIRIKEGEAGRGKAHPNMLLVVDPHGKPIMLPGEKTVERTSGLPAMWVADHHREEAVSLGLSITEPQSIIAEHLVELVKEHMSDLISYSDTLRLLDAMDDANQVLLGELIPSQFTIGGVQRVLQNLLREHISIRDLPTIIEGIAEAAGHSRNVVKITEHVRVTLALQISQSMTSKVGYIPLIALSPAWEQEIIASLVGDGDDQQLIMAPQRFAEFVAALRQTYRRVPKDSEKPVLLTSPTVRPYVASVAERVDPAIFVMSQSEVHPKARIKTIGTL